MPDEDLPGALHPSNYPANRPQIVGTVSPSSATDRGMLETDRRVSVAGQGLPFSLTTVHPSRWNTTPTVATATATSTTAGMNPFTRSAEMSEMSALMFQHLAAASAMSVNNNASTTTAATPIASSSYSAATVVKTNPLSHASRQRRVEAAERAQAEREEELLLKLLLARHRRQIETNNLQHNLSFSNESFRRQSSLTDDLLRLSRDSSSSQTILNQQQSMENSISAFGNSGTFFPANAAAAALQSQKQQQSLNSQLGFDSLERIDTHTMFPSGGIDAIAEKTTAAVDSISGKRSLEKMKEDNSVYAAVPSYHGEQQQHIMVIGQPPAKRKRLHKKKPEDMPRRPLSAYNLFFSEERERILREIDNREKASTSTTGSLNIEGEHNCDDTVVAPCSGGRQREEMSSSMASPSVTAADAVGSSLAAPAVPATPQTADVVVEAAAAAATTTTTKKPKALLRPLVPTEKKRRKHRKTHGKISFKELAQTVGQRWKTLSSERRKYYEELAKEDMNGQKKAMEEYYKKQAENLS